MQQATIAFHITGMLQEACLQEQVSSAVTLLQEKGYWENGSLHLLIPLLRQSLVSTLHMFNHETAHVSISFVFVTKIVTINILKHLLENGETFAPKYELFVCFRISCIQYIVVTLTTVVVYLIQETSYVLMCAILFNFIMSENHAQRMHAYYKCSTTKQISVKLSLNALYYLGP